MSNKTASKFLAHGKPVTIYLESEKGPVERQFTVRPRSLNANLEFVRFIGELMDEGKDIQERITQRLEEANGEDFSFGDFIVGLVQDKISDLGRLIIPEMTEEEVMDSYLDCWADALEAYAELNFQRTFGAAKNLWTVVQGRK